MSKKAKKAAKRLAKAEHEATGTAARARHAPPVAALGAVGDLADQPPLFLLSAGALAVGLATRRPQLIRTGMRMLVAEAVATGLKTLVKRSVDRARPSHALDGAGPQVKKGRGASDTAYNSLPSGHTAGAVAVGQAVAHENAAAALPARVAAGLVGAVQLPHGRHYLSDVMIGAAIGWLAERVAGAAVNAADRMWAQGDGSAPAEAEAEAHPS